MKTGAEFSRDRVYRYLLFRTWKEDANRITYVLLNPSTADESKDDPTVKRCVGRALNLGFGGIDIVNLFALRSTYPHNLKTSADPVGPDNDMFIRIAARRSSLVICGWGKPPMMPERAGIVLELIRSTGRIPYALKLNADGSPAHPLYLPYSREPFRIPR